MIAPPNGAWERIKTTTKFARTTTDTSHSSCPLIGLCAAPPGDLTAVGDAAAALTAAPAFLERARSCSPGGRHRPRPVILSTVATLAASRPMAMSRRMN